ncbi:MAG: bifunctional (p)ppGpp synthetase/guanosine-3',5'-bis(diphosphate) 3'-pyrophosphohydrolase [Candidatus Pacebacteria bacterium]|nr:bifunctional (p)ppGpp synthetase/guanosine-3',5'-bis(diphosphate) 3'-pyrophosphohydrolase [Candidatus Paceibacterota bacterium]
MSARDILNLLPVPPTEKDTALIEHAYIFAKKAHQEQKRYEGEPYFTHLFETAKILAELGMSAVTITAGLLHDVVEDKKATSEQVEKEFGSEILFLVEGVTKVGKIEYHGIERYNESLRKLLVATSQDIRVIIIKLCDRLHNMRTLNHLPEYKQQRIAKETLDIYVRIAYRLGIRRIQRELENLAFPYVYPKEYKEINELIKHKEKEDARQLEKFQKSLRKALAKAGIRDFKTDYRIKSMYSLYKKYLRKNRNIEKIYDILAIRVIAPTIEDCYKVLGVIHSVWKPVLGRIKDHIAFPKIDGYQSIHTTIFTGDGAIVEIQIKTEEMYKRAEYGMHFIYKNEYGSKDENKDQSTFAWVLRLLPSLFFRGRNEKPIQKKLKRSSKNGENNDIPKWVKELAEYQASLSTNKKDFAKNLQADFFDERIFVFTPKGDVIDLPIYSTPVDFAYNIHSDIGNHMSGAKVNGKLISFDSSLNNGDIVEIIIKQSATPSHKWLESVKTTLARKQIKSEIARAEEKKYQSKTKFKSK